MLADGDIEAILLTLRLASLTTILLILIGTPLAWWLSRSRSRIRHGVSALVTLPLILPPTVLGFYLLLVMSSDSPLGGVFSALGITGLAFTFEGLVFASVIYSLPFMVQPVRDAFSSLGEELLEAAATLRASPWRRFRTITLPLSRHGLLTGTVLTFAHTIGEFGVVLMIGGNFPGETRVLSIAIFDHVENMRYEHAHVLAGGMLLVCFLVLLGLYKLNHTGRNPLA
jgi:molybdate transport system permease protein